MRKLCVRVCARVCAYVCACVCVSLWLGCTACTQSVTEPPVVSAADETVLAATPLPSPALMPNPSEPDPSPMEPTVTATPPEEPSQTVASNQTAEPDQTDEPNQTTGPSQADEPNQATDSLPPTESTVAVTAWLEGLRNPYPDKYKTTPDDPFAVNDPLSWYYLRNKDHQPPTAQQDFDIRLYGAYYLGEIKEKVVYLTFDEGYENGCTGTILDILKEKNVPAAFFMTQTFIRDNPELAKRIAEEGHVAANHSVRHIGFPKLTDEEIAHELNETVRYFEEVTGYTMSPFFRPPSGEYSLRTLALTQSLGYTTVFWSFAHEDWLLDNQPGKDVTFNRVMDYLHPGEIMLLHAVSESNTEALPDIIDAIRAEGYTFKSLYDLPTWDTAS